jgi:sugar phosphate isomerase/epimerase
MRYGVKAALNDARKMSTLDVELVEVHLLVEDLARRRSSLVEMFREVRGEWGHDIVVHAPEFMPSPGEPILVDLSSLDRSVRQMSIASLEASIAFAQEVEACLIVTHPGGIHPSVNDPAADGGLDRLVASLETVQDEARDANVLLTLENMPWFYHKKPAGDGKMERWLSTILVKPSDAEILVQACDGLTLDVSHGYLHSPKGGMEVIKGFIDDHVDHIRHVHLSDALPPDHEGLQVGEGAVDFSYILGTFKGMDVSAVPEIMGGHMGGGISFKRALEELRRIESST